MKKSDVLNMGWILSCVGFICANASATEPVASLTPGTAAPTASSDTRYGLFNGLDHRSSYGDGVYPEPFLVDDSNLEHNEVRFNWLRLNGKTDRTDELTAELEKGFGNLTVELELHYVWDRADGQTTHGFDNVDVGARYPLFEYVAPKGSFDNTVGVAIEVGIPTCSDISKNTKLVPKVFDDLRVGDHFTMQTLLGYSALYGSGDEGGLDTFEYGVVFGYSIDHHQLPIPGLLQLVPVFEFSGETELNKDQPGHNSLIADAGFRFNTVTIGRVSPRLGITYVFPVDTGASEELRSGVFTSLVFEF